MFLPRGEGEACGMFSLPHIISLVIILIIIGIALYKCKNLEENNVIKITKIFAIILTILEIIKITYNLYYGYNNLDNYFPLSFCSLFIYSLYLYSYGNNIFKKLGQNFIVGGAVFAGLAFLVFPTTSLTMHPIYHYLSIYSMIYHGAMLYIGLLIYINNLYKFNIKNYIIYISYCIFFMAIAIILNTIYNSNLMFLSNLYVLTPFIKPIDPILTKSSKSIPVFSYFFAKKTTNLKLCSISLLLAYSSPFMDSVT